jgi:hypothetical protein
VSRIRPRGNKKQIVLADRPRFELPACIQPSFQRPPASHSSSQLQSLQLNTIHRPTHHHVFSVIWGVSRHYTPQSTAFRVFDVTAPFSWSETLTSTYLKLNIHVRLREVHPPCPTQHTTPARFPSKTPRCK